MLKEEAARFVSQEMATVLDELVYPFSKAFLQTDHSPFFSLSSTPCRSGVSGLKTSGTFSLYHISSVSV